MSVAYSPTVHVWLIFRPSTLLYSVCVCSRDHRDWIIRDIYPIYIVDYVHVSRGYRSSMLIIETSDEDS